VQQLGGLALHGLDHRRVAVAGARDRDARVQVEEYVAVDVFDDRARPAARHERIGAGQRRRRDPAVALDARYRLGTGHLGDELGPGVRRQAIELHVLEAHSAITVLDCSRRYCST
jgi:hypothetical protein